MKSRSSIYQNGSCYLFRKILLIQSAHFDLIIHHFRTASAIALHHNGIHDEALSCAMLNNGIGYAKHFDFGFVIIFRHELKHRASKATNYSSVFNSNYFIELLRLRAAVFHPAFAKRIS